MSEHVFTYKVTVKATKSEGDGNYSANDLEAEVRQLFDEVDGESVYVSNDGGEEIAFDTGWTAELQG